MLKTKRFWMIFGISFGAAVVITLFLLLVVFKGFIYNIYVSKGDADFNAGRFEDAIEEYDTARHWHPKKQSVYLKLAKTYAEMEDFENAGAIIDEAIKKKVTTKDSGLEELYIMRVKVFSGSGKLSDAVNYINSLDDQYILKKIEAARPDDLSYTPTQGSYDRSLKMTITVREGETVYYTTDGSYPSRFSNIYVDPITIGNGTTRITAVSVNAEGLVSPMLSVTYEVTNEYEEVVFDDPKMEAMVRASLSKPTGVIRVKELEGVTELSNGGIEGELRTLSDLELMPNLKSFHIEGEKNLVSVSQLSGRTQLTSLTLAGCGLETNDINALGSLTMLESVDLSDNNITSISVLSNLPALKYAFVTRNNIEDLSPLSKLSSLLLINASENRIQTLPDLPVSLEALHLSKNSISDLSSIHTLKNLTILDLSSNLIRNGKNISKLTKLDTLLLSGNNITSFDFLSELKELLSLDVSDTPFVNAKPLKSLPLVYLDAENTSLSTVTDIAKISTLTSLNIANTGVTEIEALSEIEYLDYLDISYCVIDDPLTLGYFKGLFTLRAIDVDVEGVIFANDSIMIVTEE